MGEAQTASGEKACDPVAALARLGGDAELYREVLQRFFADSATSLERISAAIDRGSGDELHRAAHSYKGLALMSGTEEVARTALALEQLGRKSQLAEAPVLLARLDEEIQRARTELAPYYQ